MPVKPRELRYAVDLGPGGEFLDENRVRLDVPAEWTPEHLLLAALVRCSLASFRYHAGRAGLSVGEASGSAHATVTKRESDERYAVVEAEVALAIAVAPEPDDLAALLAKAERDCFVSASLTVQPRYRWTVNGRAWAARSHRRASGSTAAKDRGSAGRGTSSSSTTTTTRSRASRSHCRA